MRSERLSRYLARAIETGAWRLHRVAERLSSNRPDVASFDDQRLDDLYVELFGRHIDEAALRHFRPRLHTGTRLHEIAVNLAQSDEYANRVVGQRESPEIQRARLERVYTALLGRPLDDDGYRYSQSLLANGMALDEVVLLLAESDEHENRVLRKHIAITDLRTDRPARLLRAARLLELRAQ